VEENNLLFIGAILSIALGVLALRLVRRNDKLPWNEAIVAHVLCLMFITKGVQNAATGYYNQTIGIDDSWQFFLHLAWSMDYIFSASIMTIAMLYPVPLLRNVKQVKIGISIVVIFIVLRLTLDILGLSFSAYGLPGILYYFAAIIWGSIYVKFRLIAPEKRNDSTKNISILAGLFTTLVVGHIWMWWPGLILQAEYFYFFDLGDFITSIFWDYIWMSGYAIGIGAGLSMLAIEIYQAINGDKSGFLYVIIPYFILGAIGYSILSVGVDSGWIAGDHERVPQIWSTFTTMLHFTIIRPLIAMYIMLKFGLFDINEETKPMAKMMSIILIVVATSAILELVQSVIPINQMISAALLGIIIAFGIGWEEKSFHSLVSNPASLRTGVESKWFPLINIPKNALNKIDLACLIYFLIALLISYILWQMDGLARLVIERGADI